MNLAKKLKNLPKRVTLIGLLCVAVLGGLVAATVLKKSPVLAPASQNSSQDSVAPEEKVPGQDYSWKGTDVEPKLIRLPTINASGYVMNVGIDAAGAVTAPGNVHIAGWFTGSSRPGEKGLSVIDGHVSGPTSDGIFASLKLLKSGDSFEVEQGNGVVIKYEVMSVQTVAVADALNQLFSQDPSVGKQLNLITCTGSYQVSTGGFDQRVIVAAKQV